MHSPVKQVELDYGRKRFKSAANCDDAGNGRDLTVEPI